MTSTNTQTPETKPAGFTGRKRNRKTRRRVLIANRAAGAAITLGGIGTILAVSLVCVFLVWVVVPLFLPSSVDLHHQAALQSGKSPGKPLYLAVDEYLDISWMALSDGTIVSYETGNGRLLARETLFESNERPVAFSFALGEGDVGFGFADGSVRLGRVGFQTDFIPDDEVPPELRKITGEQVANFREGILQRTPEGQFRLQRLHVKLAEPVKVKTDSELALIDLSVSSKGTILAALTKDARLHLARVTERKNLLTGKVTAQLKEGDIPVELPGGKLPTRLLLAGLGDNVFLAWDDGLVQRYDARNITGPVLAETVDLVEEPGEHLTALTFLLGKTSLVSGDSAGRVRVWFRIKPDDAVTPDGAVLVRGHELPTGEAAVTALAPSPRSRTVAAAYADNRIRLFHVTSEKQLAEWQSDAAPQSLIVAPKDDAVFALAGDRFLLWSIDAPHPEISTASILRPVWYEGYNKPESVWQSSSGTDDFEEKYGLMPLIFGTLKATVYSMLFGVPLALLAAVYTSEFLTPRAKSRIKPAIEIMASLPSVVLGFLAALFFAPLVENIIPQCLSLFIAVPFAYLLGAYLWQLFPAGYAVRARRFRMAGMIAALPLGFVLDWGIGGMVEKWLFAGDIKAWLDGQIGTGAGAWMFLLLPLSALAVARASNAYGTPMLRRWAGQWSRFHFALLDLGKFLACCLTTLLLAYAASWLLDAVGWDPRGGLIGTYVQRNALVVGFIMGFAIIPIIYTISDDALSAVPDSLRAGSLATGATRWQTAFRVVIPTAMSGLFSAVMIGLGRAVGETMIVLMAAGNTPVMDWNIFNGFRTLSANIAVELPEAVINSTHYRMLFLAALALFAMTFVVNTVAEVVRLRFRKKAFQL